MNTGAAAKPFILGLLGGVASGKSLVAGYLEELGAGRLDADRAGHEVLKLPEVVAAIRARWGEAVFDADGHVARPAVAKIVFAPTDEGRRELAFLESITHPLIGERLKQDAERMAAAGRRVLVLDAPVMLKAGWDALCDAIVYVDAPESVRLERALKRGWTAEHFAAREQAQESPDIKRKRANYVVDNAGNPESTRSQVAELWRKLPVRVE
jgi:dephospho-CoA kinase